MQTAIKHLIPLSVALSFGACVDVEPDDLATDDESAVTDVASRSAQLSFYCPGVDKTAGVPTYRGLAGTYQRVGFPAAAEPYRLSLLPVVDDPAANGAFAGSEGTASGLVVPYAGSFRTLPDNPAIGAVLSLDIAGNGTFDRTYFVLGLRRSVSDATVEALCLQGGGNPFLLSRTFIPPFEQDPTLPET